MCFELRAMISGMRVTDYPKQIAFPFLLEQLSQITVGESTLLFSPLQLFLLNLLFPMDLSPERRLNSAGEMAPSEPELWLPEIVFISLLIFCLALCKPLC